MANKSIEELVKLATEGNLQATYELGNRYYTGNGVKQDYKMAIDYFRKAEEIGNKNGSYGIAECYYYGRGIKQDYEKAYNIFYDLMENYDDTRSAYYIGLMYYEGHVVEQDYERAFNIFKDLMKKENDEKAMLMVGNMYYYGEYVEIDYIKAYEIFNELYSTFGNYYGLLMMAEMYYYGKAVKQNKEKSREILDTLVNKKGKYYFEELLNKKYDNMYFYLWSIYQNEKSGVNKEEIEKYIYKIQYDFCRAVMYYILAVYNENDFKLEDWMDFFNRDRDNTIDKFKKMPNTHPCVIYYNRLASLNDEQYDFINNILKSKIKKYCQKKYITLKILWCDEDVNILTEIMLNSSKYSSMKKYIKKEKNNCKVLYLVGNNFNYIKKDKRKAFKYYKKSAKMGYSKAEYELASLYLNEKRTKNNIKKGMNWLEKSIESDNADAQYLMGKLYYEGEIVQENKEYALELINKSAAQRCIFARKFLDNLEQNKEVED